MFESLFGSKNKKLVKGWSKEHEKIVVLAHKIIAAYSIEDIASLRQHLIDLRVIAINHIMTEDIEFYKLLKDESRLTPEIEKGIHEFVTSFEETKSLLRSFLRTYTQENAQYDEKFFKTFNAIVDALGKRIEFEEKNLYSLLEQK